MVRILAAALVFAVSSPTGAQELRLNIIQESVTLEKSDLVYAQAFFRDGRWTVEIRFTFLAAGKFREITGRHTGRSMQVVIGDRILSEPVILGQINDGTVVLEGNFNEAQAKDIAARLK